MTTKTKKIKKLMIDKNLSNRDLANLAGVDDSFISHVIRGRRVSKNVMRLIACRLDIDVAKIFPEAA